MAWEIFSLRFLREVVNDNILPLQAFPNGSPRAPVAGGQRESQGDFMVNVCPVK